MKFLNLLKKELSELINKQMIFGLAATMIILALVGNIMKSTINDAVSENYTVNITDSDDTEFSHELIDMLKQNGVSVNLFIHGILISHVKYDKQQQQRINSNRSMS